MRSVLLLVSLACCAAWGADADFNGRWDISYPDNPIRASWLEVTGAGTASPRVRFVSAYNGDMNVTDEVTTAGGDLSFAFRTKQRGRQGEQPREVVYENRATLSGGKLIGSSKTSTSTQPPVQWVGVRAPEIKDKDDGSWREGKPVALLSPNSLAGWEPLEKNRQSSWTVTDGVLKSSGGGANLVSTDKFWNFKLHLEYRVAQGSNSGVGLRGRYEIQIIDDYGKQPDPHSNGSLYSRIAPSVNAGKPAGEWQSYDITLIGRDLTVVLNGVKVLDRQVIEGLTAMGHDPNEGEPGPLSLQGDHGPIEFRNIVITPLIK
jgi:hypothetical protein